MARNPRLSHLISGFAGGAAAVVLGGGLIAADVIETGETTRTVVQQSPITRPAADDGEGLTVSEIYDRSAPGVVHVEARVARPRTLPFGFPEERPGTATGSGFVIDEQGHLLTNAHVVEGARDVTVRFGNEEEDAVEAKVVGADVSTDLALLKIDPKAVDLKPIPLGDSGRLRVGDPVIAIGNPFQLDRTVTTGIVSALQRRLPARNLFSISNVIQTDASINPGNSGGPLLDATGEVIGINSAIATPSPNRGSVGIGFAVPVNTAKSVVPQLKEDGKVERAYLGVTTRTVGGELAEDLNLEVDRGALVLQVAPDGPADKAGLRGGRTRISDELTAGGDLIVKVDGKDVTKSEDIAAAIADNKPGDQVVIEYFRGDDRRTARVKLGQRPDEAPPGGGGFEPPDDPPDVFPFP